jgi:hypothetical protein
MADYYSRYFDILQLHDTKSTTIIRKLRSLFAKFGISTKVMSDNGPQYSSQEFADFAKHYDFVHCSSPRYPQSNGLAGKYVKIAKRILEKSKSDGRDPFLGILEYHTIPLDIGFSPAELLQARQLRSVLPVVSSQLLPKCIDHNKVKVMLQQCHEQQKSYFDKHSKSLAPFDVGDKVRFQQDNKIWKPAQVLEKVDDRSYIVNVPNGGIYRRNRRHLMKTAESHVAPDVILRFLFFVDSQSNTKSPESVQLFSTQYYHKRIAPILNSGF